MTTDFEKIQAERERAEKLSKQEQFERKMARLPDHEFHQLASELCREGDQAAERRGPTPPHPSVLQSEPASSVQVNDSLANYGIGFRLPESLSESNERGRAREQRRRESEIYDAVANEHQRRIKR